MIQGGKYKHLSFLLRRGFAYTSAEDKISLVKQIWAGHQQP